MRTGAVDQEMLQIGRYYFKSFHPARLVATRSWLSTFSSDLASKPQSERVSIQGVIQQPVNSSIFQPYDVIVVGGGHAGCEGK